MFATLADIAILLAATVLLGVGVAMTLAGTIVAIVVYPWDRSFAARRRAVALFVASFGVLTFVLAACAILRELA